MRPDLPLEPLHSLIPTGQPFTPAMARNAGITRASLERMLRHGIIRRVIKGVYVDATVADSVETRAMALSMIVPKDKVVSGRTASWLWGVKVSSGRGLLETTTASGLTDCDVRQLHGLRATTPLRTALDLGRTLNPERALATLDGLLRIGLVKHRELLAELPRFAGHAGVRQLRELVACADGRAGSEAESVLRLRWLDARLPTPIPRLAVGENWVELGLPLRRFAAVFSNRWTSGELAWARTQGWCVVELSAPRVLGSDPELVSGHLEREFHRHLLAQAG